jgi:hypothetical protein
MSTVVHPGALIAVLAFAAAAALTGLLRKIAGDSGVVDVPNPRSSHDTPTPRGARGAGAVQAAAGIRESRHAGGAATARRAASARRTCDFLGLVGGRGRLSLPQRTCAWLRLVVMSPSVLVFFKPWPAVAELAAANAGVQRRYYAVGRRGNPPRHRHSGSATPASKSTCYAAKIREPGASNPRALKATAMARWHPLPVRWRRVQ